LKLNYRKSHEAALRVIRGVHLVALEPFLNGPWSVNKLNY